MTDEKGSDARLPADADAVMNQQLQDAEAAQRAEEELTAAQDPARDEPGEQHPDVDETPPGDPPEFDPLPPE